VKVLGTTGYQEVVKVEIVELSVTVVDHDGKLVTGLPRDAFRVLEDGTEVPLEAFYHDGGTPAVARHSG